MIFVLTMVLAVVYSCGETTDGGSPGGGADPGDELPGEHEDEYDEADLHHRLPFEPAEVDLGGRVFNFAACGWGAETTSAQRDVIAEELNGETINDAVYMRNAVIMDMFNCTIGKTMYDAPEPLLTGLRNSINAGDGQFDAAYIRFGQLNTLATGGFLQDLKLLPNMDLDQPWWDQNSIAQTSIMDRLFSVNGDIQILDKGAINAFVFNKQLQAEYQIEDLYYLVKDGKWTLGKMLEISRLISSDLNGDGEMDENDRYGLFYYRDSIPAFLVGAGEFIARKDAEDIPYMSFNSERVFTVLDSIYEVIYDEDVAFHTMRAFGDAGFIIEGTRMFQNSQALLYYIRMTEIEGLRGMDTDFGVLPFPKYDENQQNYLSLVNASIGSALAVPSTAEAEVSGAVLEAMAYESRYTLIPAYYEVTLKGKISRDDDSEEMLNIIFGNMTYDLGGVYDLGGIVGELMYHTMTLGRNMASFYDRSEPRAIRDIDRLIDNFSAMD